MDNLALNLDFLWVWVTSNWLTVFGVLATVTGLFFGYLAIRKPRWRKYYCRGLPYERIFRRGDYGYDPQMFLKDVGSVDLALRELSTWYADDKPLLLRGMTGIGKSRLVTEFIGGLGIWHRLWTRVLMPTPHEFNERFPPFLPGRYILFLNDLHEFRGCVPDDKLRFYAEDRRFKVVATIPSEKSDSDWSIPSSFIWCRLEVQEWKPEEGRRLAEARKTVFSLDDFKGTPLSVIAPAAEMKRSYELLPCDRKAVLEALKIVKTHLGCYADYELLSKVPVGSGRFDETAFTDIIAKQRLWCKADNSTAMLADGMEDFVDYPVSIEDAYELEALLMREEPTLRNREKYLFYLGNDFSRMGEIQKALKCYDLSKKLDPRFPSLWLNRGNVLHVLGKIEGALDSCRQAKEAFEKLGDQFGIAASLHQLGIIEHDRGNYDEAKNLYDQSLDIKRKLGNQSGIAITLHQLANIEYSRGNYDEAKNVYDHAKEAFEKLGDQFGIAASLHQLGMIEQARGNYDEAKNLYDQSLTIERKLGYQFGIAVTLDQLAMLQHDRGNYDEAEILFNESLEISRKLGYQSGIATTLHNLAMIEGIRGNYDKAKSLFNESLEIKRKLGSESGIASTVGQLGRLAEKHGDFENAEQYYEQALEVFEKLGEKPNIEIAKKNLERVRKLKQKKT